MSSFELSIGASPKGEAFFVYYELPNNRGTEGCV